MLFRLVKKTRTYTMNCQLDAFLFTAYCILKIVSFSENYVLWLENDLIFFHTIALKA